MKSIILIFLSLGFINLLSSENTDESNLVKVELNEDSKTLYDKGTNYLVFKFSIAEHWHIYWLNPGDSGLPTEIELDAPEGVKVGDILWPAPAKIPFDDLANYGYSNQVELLVPITLEKDFESQSINIKADISWLVCKEKCIGQDTSFSFKANISDKKENLIDLTDYQFDKLEVDAYSDIDNEVVELQFDDMSKNLEFFPFEGGYFKTMGQTQTSNSDKAQIILKLEEYRFEEPTKLEGLMISDDKVYRVSTEIKEKN